MRFSSFSSRAHTIRRRVSALAEGPNLGQLPGGGEHRSVGGSRAQRHRRCWQPTASATPPTVSHFSFSFPFPSLRRSVCQSGSPMTQRSLLTLGVNRLAAVQPSHSSLRLVSHLLIPNGSHTDSLPRIDHDPSPRIRMVPRVGPSSNMRLLVYPLATPEYTPAVAAIDDRNHAPAFGRAHFLLGNFEGNRAPVLTLYLR